MGVNIISNRIETIDEQLTHKLGRGMSGTVTGTAARIVPKYMLHLRWHKYRLPKRHLPANQTTTNDRSIDELYDMSIEVHACSCILQGNISIGRLHTYYIHLIYTYVLQSVCLLPKEICPAIPLHLFLIMTTP